MRYPLCGLALLICITSAFPQTPSADQAKSRHDLEDQVWARKSGLTATDVRALRVSAGISDASINHFVRNIDGRSLITRNHVLFVDFQSGCSRVRVLERNGADFKEIWFFPGVPDPVWGFRERPKGQENCAQIKGKLGMGTVNARGTPDGKIVVEVRFDPEPSQRTIPVETYTFSWDGKHYQPEAPVH